MANFTCDICGGTIKMQADRTGVCQECGMEYDIEAIKAMINNNTSSSSVSSPVSRRPVKKISDSESKPINRNKTSAVDYPLNSVTPNNREIDRNALLIYLNDVRTLETVINNAPQTVLALENAIEQCNDNAIPHDIYKPKKPPKPVLSPTKESPERGLKVLFIIGLVGLLLFVILALPYAHTSGFIGALFFVGLIFIGMMIPFIVDVSKKSSKYSNALARHNEAMKKYEEGMAQYTLLMEEYNKKADEYINIANKKVNKIKTAKNSINKELAQFTKLLKKAYSANIIPMQFRNIEGVYYLYDYLSTSNQTLSEALMQANLEAIKQKLDKMIKMQAVNVIQQAQTNAKLDNIVQQNTQILKTAERTAANTELAAKYAAISAVNSEITKQLSQEQLAYQKADFWLK